MPLNQAALRPPQNDTQGSRAYTVRQLLSFAAAFVWRSGRRTRSFWEKADLRRSGCKSLARNRPRTAQYRSCHPSRGQSRCRRARGQIAGYPIPGHHLARDAQLLSPPAANLSRVVVEDDQGSVRLANLQRRILPNAGQRAVMLVARSRLHRTSVAVPALLIERDRLRCFRDQLVEPRIAPQFIPARI